MANDDYDNELPRWEDEYGEDVWPVNKTPQPPFTSGYTADMDDEEYDRGC